MAKGETGGGGVSLDQLHDIVVFLLEFSSEIMEF